MLNRIVAAMDFYCRAQGKNGGFLGPPIPGRSNVNWPSWLGGPERESGLHGLEVGQQHIYKSFYMLLPEIQEAGVLDERFDHDLNPDTPNITRRQAYTEMTKRSFKKMKSNVIGSSVANQNLHNFPAYYHTYRIIEELAPQMARRLDHDPERIVKILAGLKKQPKYNQYIFSPDGLSQENGYTAGGYGRKNPRRLANVHRMTDFDFVPQRVRDAYDAYSHFQYLTNDDDGHRRLENVSWISTRAQIGIPGGRCYLDNRYAAYGLEVPVAIRNRQRRQKHNQGGEPGLNDWLKSDGGWTDKVNKLVLAGRTLSAIKVTENLRKQLKSGSDELPSTDYPLPTEREADSAFVDPHNQAATLRHDDGTLFIRMWGDDLARLRYRRPTFERLAHIPVDNVGPKRQSYFGDGSMLNVMRYGPYLVVMNGSGEQGYEFEVPKPFRKSAGNRVKELQENKTVELPPKLEVPPMEGYAFVIE
jgi:hypothetical protein